MSEVRQWVELDPTNGADAAKPQEASQDLAKDAAPDAVNNGGKDTPAPTNPGVEGGA